MLPFIALGNNAVPVFCMLSGLSNLSLGVRTSAADELRKYTVRRILRIFTCYVVTIVACISIGRIPPSLPGIFNDVFKLGSRADALDNPLRRRFSVHGFLSHLTP